MQPLIIDVEASGFGRGSYPIEVGVAMAGGETHCMLIRPLPEWQHWDCTAEKLHGISREVLQQHGRGVREVAEQLNQWLGGETAYSDAWGNDSSWISLLFESAELSQHFRIKSLRDLLTDPQVRHWHQTKKDIASQHQVTRHRASTDAKLIQQTFCRTLETNTSMTPSSG